jgi:hypothetical protein
MLPGPSVSGLQLPQDESPSSPNFVNVAPPAELLPDWIV